MSALLSRNEIPASALEQLLGSAEVTSDLTRGLRLPSLHEATLLGALLGVDPTVLTGEKTPPLGVSLRLGTAPVQHDVEAPVAHAMKLLAAARLIAEWGFDSPCHDMSGFSPSRNEWNWKSAGKKTAERLRAYLGIDPAEPIGDLTGLVESLGHPVERMHLPKNVHGISVPELHGARKNWVVLINCDDQWARQRFTIAHELSHIIYDDSGQIIVDRAEAKEAGPEVVADSFARHLLFPEDALREMLAENPARDLAAIRNLTASSMIRFGISRQAALKAFRESPSAKLDPALLDACEDESVASMMAFCGAGSTWSEMEDAKGMSSSSPRLTDQVLTAFADGVVGLGTAADVIAGGDQEEAVRLLREAGWDLSAATSSAL